MTPLQAFVASRFDCSDLLMEVLQALFQNVEDITPTEKGCDLAQQRCRAALRRCRGVSVSSLASYFGLIRRLNIQTPEARQNSHSTGSSRVLSQRVHTYVQSTSTCVVHACTTLVCTQVLYACTHALYVCVRVRVCVPVLYRHVYSRIVDDVVTIEST